MIDETRLIELARSARANAYAPYSGVSVGAAVLTEGGKVYTGANIENASYPAGICAERSAIFSAISDGERKINAIAISGATVSKTPSTPFFPCGICRQVMAEFADENFRIYVDSGDGVRSFTMGELLPHGFKLN